MIDKKELEQIFDELFPIPRSLTGDGVRLSHQILAKYITLETKEHASGKQVFDWKVPKEWKVNNAFIITPDGRKICDFHENNLHLINYSVPFTGKMQLSELKSYLHSMEEMPDAIPYKTSYYREQWGFCLSQNDKDALPEGEYQVVVDTEHFDGSMTISECVVQGNTSRQVLVHTYTCHPSLAINELSGVLVTFLVAHYFQERAKESDVTFRFVFAPETIGAITYIEDNLENLKANLVGGLICTCVGHSGQFTYKSSRNGNSLIDRAVRSVFDKSQKEIVYREFSPSGSDERQYCSLGINLPVGSLMRTPYHEYDEYHTSLDNKDIMNFDAIIETAQQYITVLEAIEMNETYSSLNMQCEPFMSNYSGLYTTKDHRFASDLTKAVKWLIHFCDGKNDLIEISKRSGIELSLLSEAAKKMESCGLINRRT